MVSVLLLKYLEELGKKEMDKFKWFLGVTFVDKYRVELIQRVRLVDPIADDLKPLIGDEKYANIRSSRTSQDKMRVLYSFLSGGATIKEKFYESLLKNELYLVKDLAG
uniref:CARD domain-containing protein n=1 Tax=Electrophorus electricus TaxID=8005 RepID=A0A4W4HMU8_ELEEL